MMRKHLLAWTLTGTMALGMAFSGPAWAGETEAETEESSSLLGLIGSLVSEEGGLNDLLGENADLDSLLNGEGGLGSLLSEEGGLGSLLNGEEGLEELLGENGLLSSILPEGVQVEELRETIDEIAGEMGISAEEALQVLSGALSGEDGSLNLGTLLQLGAGMMQNGDAVSDWAAFDDFASSAFDVARAYVAEQNAPYLEEGDVQTIIFETAYPGVMDDGSYKLFGTICEVNFTAEGTDLKEKNSAVDTMLLTYEKTEDGTYQVIDVKKAEDGEGFEASLNAMCEEVGITSDFYYNTMGLADISYLEGLRDCLQEHTDYERVEYMGELCTLDDLNNRIEEAYTSLYEEEALTEEALTEVGEPATEETL